MDELQASSTPVPERVPHLERAPRGQLFAGLAAILPLGLLTCWMAVPGNSPVSVPFGFACAVTSIVGILALLQSSEHEPRAPLRDANTRGVLKELGLLTGACCALLLALRLAVSGTLPVPLLAAAILIPALFLGSVVAVFRLAREL
ncbi:MAG TPA: hypothetical protein VFU02_02135, partial [Polyangiaceae bacterium]|nr:hypothetical protein [Polyangiaceae bacterium]